MTLAAANCPLVSIALCTYNGGRRLSQQLDSLIVQTYPNLEIVVSDDGSTDDTLAILARYAQLDPRIRVAANAANVGLTANFERAMRLCRGVYIAPCDQDDVWLPEKVAVLVGAIGGSSLVYCDSTLVDDRGESVGIRMSQVVPMLSTDDPAPFAFGNCVSGHAMLFNRELLAWALPTPSAFFYDWWIAAVAASAKGIVFCNQSLVLYRQHGGNVTDMRLGEMLQEAGLRDSARIKPSQPRGHKLRYVHETRQRLEALARLPGRRQKFILELLSLWRARERQWLSPALGALMMRNRDRLLAATTLSARRKKRYCRELFLGLRLRRLLEEHAYAQT